MPRAYFSSSKSALASFKSAVSNPSAKEFFSGRSLAEPSLKSGHAAIFGDVEKPSWGCRLIGHDIVMGFYRPLLRVVPKNMARAEQKHRDHMAGKKVLRP